MEKGGGVEWPEGFVKIWLADKANVESWWKRLQLLESDPKDHRRVQRLDCRRACASFDVPVTPLEVAPDTTASDLLLRHLGERPRIYTRDELRAALPPWADEQQLAFAARQASWCPTAELQQVRPGLAGWGPAYDAISAGTTLSSADVRDGDVLALERTSLPQLCAFAVEARNMACVEMVRGADEFFAFVQSPVKPSRRRGRRPRIGILYTDEDIQLASYLRTHFDALDRLSGDRCDFFFIENPGAVNPVRFWRPLLSEKLCVAWRLLGWSEFVPYDKASAYDIARLLEIDCDALPCACVFTDDDDSTAPRLREVVPLTSNLAADFRRLVSRFSGTTSAILPGDERPTCFLSHASVDKHLVRQVAVTLHSLGIDTWFDERQMRAGDPVVGKIQEGLESAKWIVLFLSRRSLDSPWLNAELEAALHAQIASRKYEAIIPVLLDPCEVPPHLRNYKQIEAGTDVPRIAEEIRRALQR
jgi:hypothetical protein